MIPLVYHHNYSCDFPVAHRFVMSKFRRLYALVDGAGWLTRDGSNLFTPERLSAEALALCHAPDYLRGLQHNEISAAAWRRVGLPWSEGLIARTFTAPAGTRLSAELALQHGIACHLAGGTHHAHTDFGSGFCLLNDLAYTARSLLMEGKVERVLVFDCDVHQGDGTAAMLAAWPALFTCSIHCEKNFPFRKHESDLDIGLPNHMSDAPYLEVVTDTLDMLLTRLQPDLVLYDAGVDVWEHDPLGKLNISWDGIAARDRAVLALCRERQVPVATVIGGGYDRDHARLAARHAIVIDTARQVFQRAT